MAVIKRVGRFELRRLIGRGAMSTVWEAVDSLGKGSVAIKFFHHPPEMSDPEWASLLRRFHLEAMSSARIEHPNIVKVYGAGEAEDGFYIVMELVRGVSMRDRLRMEGRFSPGSAAEVAIQLCGALGAAHKLGTVHCDLKPENVLLEPVNQLHERVKLVDFGMANAFRAPKGMPGAWGGSPAYMSPEQASGGPLDGRSDIFSLGVVLFETLTGQAAFEGDSIVAVLHRVVSEPIAVERIPDPFKAIVAKAVEKRPYLRFATVEEMKEALQRAVA